MTSRDQGFNAATLPAAGPRPTGSGNAVAPRNTPLVPSRTAARKPVPAAPAALVAGPAARAASTAGAGTKDVDPAAEEAYWREQFRLEPYFVPDSDYADYGPAYLTGYLAHGLLAGSRYEDIEGDLERDYSANRGGSRLTWVQAKAATRAAWDRVDRV